MCCVAAIAPFALASPQATAQPMPIPTQETGWSFAVTPYFWAAGIKGTVATPFERLPRREISADFDTIFSDITGFVGMVGAEARKDRIALVGDVVTIGVAADASTPRDLLFSGAKGELELTFATVSALYRIVQGERLFIDVGVGMRGWWASTTLSANSGLLPGRSVGGSATWADPLVNARALFRLSEQLTLSAYADAGGFSVGSDSTWQVAATIDWLPAPWVALRAGWRYLAVDRSSPDLAIDVSLNGPVIGATFRF